MLLLCLRGYVVNRECVWDGLLNTDEGLIICVVQIKRSVTVAFKQVKSTDLSCLRREESRNTQSLTHKHTHILCRLDLLSVFSVMSHCSPSKMFLFLSRSSLPFAYEYFTDLVFKIIGPIKRKKELERLEKLRIGMHISISINHKEMMLTAHKQII